MEKNRCYRWQRRWKWDIVIGGNPGGSGTLLMFDDYLLSKDTVKCDTAWDLDTVIGDNAGGSVTQF